MIRRLIVCGALLGALLGAGCDNSGGSADPKIETGSKAPDLKKQTPGGAPAAPGANQNPAPGGKPIQTGASSQ